MLSQACSCGMCGGDAMVEAMLLRRQAKMSKTETVAAGSSQPLAQHDSVVLRARFIDMDESQDAAARTVLAKVCEEFPESSREFVHRQGDWITLTCRLSDCAILRGLSACMTVGERSKFAVPHVVLQQLCQELFFHALCLVSSQNDNLDGAAKLEDVNKILSTRHVWPKGLSKEAAACVEIFVICKNMEPLKHLHDVYWKSLQTAAKQTSKDNVTHVRPGGNRCLTAVTGLEAD
eukprot:766965-Hanusia_phi.AAC.2